MPRPIPKRVFQFLAVGLFLLAWAYGLWACREHEGPYRWMRALTQDRFLRSLGTMLIVTVAVMPVVWGLRRLSRMPTTREELDAAGVKTLGELFAKRVSSKLKGIRPVTKANDPVRYHKGAAVAFGICGGLGVLLGVLFWLDVVPGLTNLTLAAPIFLLGVPYHLVQRARALSRQ